MSLKDEIDFRSKRSSQIMTYPSNGQTLKSAQAGRYRLTLVDGKVMNPSLVDDNFDRSLTKMLDRKCRSALIWVSDSDASIKLGGFQLPVGIKLVQVIDFTGFEELEINFPTTRIPANDFEFLVICSTIPKFPVNHEKYNANHQNTITGSATDAYAVILQKNINHYTNIMITTVDTSANGLTVQIQYSEDGTNWYNDPNYVVGKAITQAGEPDKYASSVNHKFIRVQVKNTTAGQVATYSLSYRFAQL